MSTSFRSETPLDRLVGVVDQGLRVVLAPASAGRATGRPTPRPTVVPDAREPLTGAEARHAAGLMRVNHAGEVAAQALYFGQALVARDAETREHLLHAAREEGDHLVWCEARLHALGSHRSVLNPVWYAGSVAIGATAALFGDAVSLGFVAETERQVEGHIDEHLAKLPPQDAESRAVLEQMKDDEIRHGRDALDRGGQDLPRPVQALMRFTSRVMTRTAYWV